MIIVAGSMTFDAADRAKVQASLTEVTALSRRDDDVAGLKGDVSELKIDVAALKGDTRVLKEDVSVLKRDMAVLKWMVGTLYPLVLAILLKLFIR